MDRVAKDDFCRVRFSGKAGGFFHRPWASRLLVYEAMQTANVNLPVVVTGRHVSVTEAMREHAHRKVQSLHLDYPRIIEVRVILDVESGFRHVAEIILYCANHITIEASSVTDDMYWSIDETVSKIARQMRKQKTKMLSRYHRGRKRKGWVQKLSEKAVAPAEERPVLEEPASAVGTNGSTPKAAGLNGAEEEPLIVRRDTPKLKRLQEHEAITEMELGGLGFYLFRHEESGRLSVVYRTEEGEYALLEPELAGLAG